MNWTAIIVFIGLFGLVTVLGFLAAYWRRGDLDQLNEWGLAGRRLGTVITWFLLGGDVYTAYTFIAVPALVFGTLGFFALPYTIVVYPLVFLILPRMWSVAHKHHYITAGDFVQGRYGDRWLALAVAITGIIATMPYIALQLLGLQVVIGAMGVGTEGVLGDLPLIIAFVILAAFTYTSGLRAPAMIAVVKDALIYITVLAMVIVIPIELGGYANIFASVPASKRLLTPPSDGTLGQFSAYATLALGSAFALFLYPHTLTGVLSATSRDVIRRNAAYLPAYSFLLGLLALTGFMAIAAGVDRLPEFAPQFAQYKSNFAVPALILHSFPDWFAGVAFAAIGIGGLVPAAIMSIAASNLFTRNIYMRLINTDCTAKQETPRRNLDQPDDPCRYHWPLLATGTWMAASTHFQSAVFPLLKRPAAQPMSNARGLGQRYAALYALTLNFAVSIVLSPLLNCVPATRGTDETATRDYCFDVVESVGSPAR
jgi:SSS family solute:Na+ symporter